jgi:hypothetical protein
LADCICKTDKTILQSIQKCKIKVFSIKIKNTIKTKF